MEDAADAPSTARSPSDGGRRSISFSVASLLADTHARSPDYRSEEDDTRDSVVDVEDVNVDALPAEEATQSLRGPVRPTPFSALAAAAAAYSHAGHHAQGLHGQGSAAWARVPQVLGHALAHYQPHMFHLSTSPGRRSRGVRRGGGFRKLCALLG